MDPKDDPEARIRELERPLVDQARASELGNATSFGKAGSWGEPGRYPPPPTTPMSLPPMPIPYSQLPEQRRRRRGPWLVMGLIFAILAVTVTMMVGAFASIWSDVRDLWENGDSTSSERDDPFTIDIPGTQADDTAEVGSVVSVAGSGNRRSVVCDGGSVSVSGVRNTVEITGQCANVTVSGVENEVHIESSDSIDSSGVDNRVTYSSGSPEISEGGINSPVEQG